MIVKKERKSPFIHKFDRTPPGINCPHFWILSWGLGCPYQCSYCYLMSTLRYQGTNPIVYKNLDSFEVWDWLKKHKKCVLNAGELADSLAFSTDYIGLLAPSFNVNENENKLLLLTKSANINPLLELDPKNIIVSFSINAPSVRLRFEHGTALIKDKIEAAKTLKGLGFDVRIRIDPIIPVVDWELEYEKLIDLILNSFIPDRITLGTLRYFPGVKVMAKKLKRDGKDSVFTYYVEMSVEDKRYRLKDRKEIYEYMIRNLLDSNFKNIGICKETLDTFEHLDKKGIKIDKNFCNCTW